MIKKLLLWWLRPFIITEGDGTPYMTRYFILKTRWGGIYLHNIHRSDRDDMHDHPWNFVTFILRGGYWEYDTDHPPLTNRKRWCGPGTRIKHEAEDIHRVELLPGVQAWTLVFVGRKRREWGFHPLAGFVPWREYCDAKYGKDNYKPAMG